MKATPRPLTQLKIAEKRAKAIAYLRSRNLYVLDKGAKKPSWGNGKPA